MGAVSGVTDRRAAAEFGDVRRTRAAHAPSAYHIQPRKPLQTPCDRCSWWYAASRARGRTTLARRLAEADLLGLPRLSGDDLKAGLIASYGAETDRVRERAYSAAFELFLHTVELWLQTGVSLIMDEALSRERGAGPLRRWARLARVVLLHCETSDAEAARRCLERERSRSRQRAADVQTAARWIAGGDYPWRVFDAFEIGVPSLRVDTSDGYAPPLPEIVAFVR